MAGRPFRLSAALVAGVLAAAAAGCGGGSASKTKNLTPQDALAQSVTALGDGSALHVRMKLAVTDQQLVDIANADPSGDRLDTQKAHLFTSGDLDYATRTTDGRKLRDVGATGKADGLFVVHTDGAAIVEMRTLGATKTLYARADVPKILQLAGQKPSQLAAQLNEVPPQFSFVKDAAAGKWLSLDLTQAQNLVKQFGAGSSALPTDPAQARMFTDKLLGVLKADTRATRAGTSDAGDHLVLTASTKDLATDLLTTLKQLPGTGASLGMLNANRVPDRQVRLDAYIKDGVLSQLSMDLTQFASGDDAKKLAGKHLPLQMTFDQTAPDIVAPTGAVPVDLAAVMRAFTMASGAASGGSAALRPLPPQLTPVPPPPAPAVSPTP